MMRTHLECLLTECSDGCLGPPYQPVPLDIWENLLDTGVVSDPFDPKEVWADEKPVLENHGYRCYYHGCGIYSISGLDTEDLSKAHEAGKIQIYEVGRIALFEMLAKQWEIKPAAVELSQECFTIGWKGQNTVVLYAHSSDLYSSPYAYCLEILESIQDDLLATFDTDMLRSGSDEELEFEDLMRKWTCRNLFVIHPGESCERNEIVQREFDKDGITLLGMHEFMTEDCDPIWGASYVPKPRLTFSYTEKRFEWSGQPIDLKPTELRIFTQLCDNLGNVVSIDEIIEGTWPSGRKRKKRAGAKRSSRPKWPESNLHTHISKINAKLKHFGMVTIENVREAGYKIIIKH